ncbi:MAG: rhodanese, partial [Thermoplasmata archaeon]|nr:rhodanese [Thermoplasmata archaeon]
MSGGASEQPTGAIDAVLAEVRTRIDRVDPADAARIQADGGLLVDIRPIEQREREGEIPGSLVVDRNVLEWRLDPTGPHRYPGAGSPDRAVVVVCQEGYASSLATESLGRLGLTRVSDLVGGFAAWKAAGL